MSPPDGGGVKAEIYDEVSASMNMNAKRLSIACSLLIETYGKGSSNKERPTLTRPPTIG